MKNEDKKSNSLLNIQLIRVLRTLIRKFKTRGHVETRNQALPISKGYTALQMNQYELNELFL